MLVHGDKVKIRALMGKKDITNRENVWSVLSQVFLYSTQEKEEMSPEELGRAPGRGFVCLGFG